MRTSLCALLALRGATWVIKILYAFAYHVYAYIRRCISSADKAGRRQSTASLSKITDQPMNIVCTSDGNYLRHCVAMLESLWEHNPDEDMHVYLIYDNVDSHKLSLAAGYLHSFLPGLSLMQASAKPLTGFPVSGHGSVAAYFRLLLPAMLPMSVERFVFIDADTIVVDSIVPLWELSLEGRALAAVGEHRLSCQDHGYEFGGYFNSGIMVVDLK